MIVLRKTASYLRCDFYGLVEAREDMQIRRDGAGLRCSISAALKGQGEGPDGLPKRCQEDLKEEKKYMRDLYTFTRARS